MPSTWPARAALLIVGLALAACGGGDGEGDADAIAGGFNEVVGDADEGIEGVQSVRVYYESPVHTEDAVDYDLRPPAGGMHHPVWANCGFYDEPIPDEHIVHDLEHAAVWLAYAPDLPPADIEVIRDVTRANAKVIATPYPDLPTGAAVVATAWARQLVLDSVDDPRLERFVVQYQDGSQAPESGATCTGTPVGEPIP
jgi:hypothetical protein